jgi:hypothetical protein
MNKLIQTGIVLILSIVLLCFVPQRSQAQSSSETESEIVIAVPNRLSVSELKIRGRIQSQYANAFGNNNNTGIEAGNYSSFEMRRARLGVQGKIYGDWNFMIEANVLSNVDLDAAILTYAAIPQANFTLGKEKPMFGHEQNTSSASILTFERTLLDAHLNGGKPLGFRIHGKIDQFSYYLGVYNGESLGTGRMGSELDSYLYNASAGLNLAGLLGIDMKADLRADYLHNGGDTGYYNFEDAIAFSGHFGIGELDLRAEYMAGNRFDNNRIYGFYVMPSYYFVPERFQAVLRYGNVNSEAGLGLGQNRYADRVPGLYYGGNEYNALYAGLNYLIHGDNLKFMLGMELAENSNDVDRSGGKVTTVFGGFRMQF